LKKQTTLRFSEMATSSNNVYFHCMKKISFFKERKKLKLFIEKIFKIERKELKGLHYIFCTDEYLLKINQRFLKHDYYTDIITFDLSETNKIYGEVYISVDRLKENAVKYNTSSSDELHRLLFHGAIHLCGYKDKTVKEKRVMTEKEDVYLKLYTNHKW